MTNVVDVMEWMENIAPSRLSADWDNTGLLLGDRAAKVERLMTCLTLTSASVEEAVESRANLVLSHHPLPFRPVKSITTADVTGKLIWQLASAKVSVYCPHTAWDSAHQGINAQIAEHLELLNVRPIVAEKLLAGMESPVSDQDQLGVGRFGDLPQPISIEEVAKRIAAKLPHCRPRVVDCGRKIKRIGIVCGSGASMLSSLIPHQCDLFLTGEATFHQCLESQAVGMSMLMIGHYASEKFAMDQLAKLVSTHFPELQVWGSLQERDPVRNLPI
jgi:dinuclear metal center YbgI/SA1388 family protein